MKKFRERTGFIKLPYLLSLALFHAMIFLLGCNTGTSRMLQKLASADKIIATNQGIQAGYMLSAEEIKNVTQAIRSSRKDRQHYSASFDWELRFFAGTNLLGTTAMQDRIFTVNKAQYSDDTGVLKQLYEGALREAAAERLSQ